MLGTDKIESLADSLKELAILIKKVSKDQKLDIQDLAYLVEFLPKLGGIIDSIKDFGEAVEEGKDIDLVEVVSLIQAFHSKIKEIKEI